MVARARYAFTHTTQICDISSDPGRRLPPQPSIRPFERSDVNVVQQRRDPGLARPLGRLIPPGEIGRQDDPALGPVPCLLTGVPHQSGPSLRSARCLRRHRRYYAPIRHPAVPEERPPVVPWPTPPPVTSRSTRQGFSGSHDFCARMIWSPTPAARHLPPLTPDPGPPSHLST